MRVSKSSWHYKLYKYRGKDKSTLDLCTYARGILGSLWSMMWTVFFGAMVVLLALDLPLTIFLEQAGFGVLLPNTGLVILSFLSYLGVSFIALVLTLAYIIEKIGSRSSLNDDKPSRTSELLRAYYKSVKDKTCIILEKVE